MRPQENKWLVLPQAINPRLEELSALPRSVECLRHFLLSIEHWLSPKGRLPWWLKMNVGLAAFLLIPAAFLMPIIGLVLHEVDGCLALLLSIVLKLILLTALALVIKSFPFSSKGSARRRK